jgi:hypothetical protein
VSTLEVACGRCEKRFRVRAEFAGRSTRCPACSAPITIAGPSRPAPPPRTEPEERPRARPRPRDEGDQPRRPDGNWKPVDTALGREQAAVLFLLASFVSSLVVLVIGNATAGQGPPDAVFIAVMVLLGFGPPLAAGVFGIAARLGAVRAPAESRSKGAAVSSLLCGLAAIAALVVLALAIMTAIGSYGPDPLVAQVAVTGAIVAGLGAVATFVVFVAQIGIAHQSADVNQAFGRTAVAMCVCVLGLLGISFLVAFVSAMSTPPFRGGQYGNHRPEEEILQIVAVVLVPVALAVLLILYHRLLGAARRAVQAGPTGRYEG